MNKWVNEPFLLMVDAKLLCLDPGWPWIRPSDSDALALLTNINIYNWNYANSGEFLLRKFALEWILNQFNSFFNATQWPIWAIFIFLKLFSVGWIIFRLIFRVKIPSMHQFSCLDYISTVITLSQLSPWPQAASWTAQAMLASGPILGVPSPRNAFICVSSLSSQFFPLKKITFQQDLSWQSYLNTSFSHPTCLIPFTGFSFHLMQTMRLVALSSVSFC